MESYPLSWFNLVINRWFNVAKNRLTAYCPQGVELESQCLVTSRDPSIANNHASIVSHTYPFCKQEDDEYKTALQDSNVSAIQVPVLGVTPPFIGDRGC